METDPDLDPPSFACYNCWKLGHARRACPDPIWPEPICHNCGRAGVIMQECPRCCDAYKIYVGEMSDIVPPDSSVAQTPDETMDLIGLNSSQPIVSLTVPEPAEIHDDLMGLEIPPISTPVCRQKRIVLPPSARKLLEDLPKVVKTLGSMEDEGDHFFVFAARVQQVLSRAAAEIARPPLASRP